MIEWLNKIDTNIFYAINNGIRSEFLDYFFGFLSANISFVIAILASIIFIYIKQLKKYWWVSLILVALSFLLADRISVMCFKDVFCRLRPSHALDGVNLVKLSGFNLVYDYKGGMYGFVSSHAANAFSLATIFALIARKHKVFVVCIYLWTVFVGYSRIYCGVHYPGDVICGAILGIAIGYIVYLLYTFIVNKYFYNKIKSI